MIVYCPEKLPAEVVLDVYQPDVQALVLQGFAVLQVNVRDSWGAGPAGRQLLGTAAVVAVQEDLDDAVHELITQQAVDPSRVTLFGREFGGVLALQVATRSRLFAAVATVNVPSEVHRDDLFKMTPELGLRPLAAKLGGWWASESVAKELAPIRVAPTLRRPALYLHDEDSIKGRPDEEGRDILAAVTRAKVPAETGLAYGWAQYPKPPSVLARENAEISLKIGDFFRRQAGPGVGN